MNVDYNTVAGGPGDRADRARSQVVPGEPEGTYRAQVRPVGRCLRAARGRWRTAPWSSRRRSRAARSTTVDGQQVTKLYGTQLGSNYLADPVLGMVRFLPDNVAWLRWILGPWVGILAATILFIATNAGIIGVSRLAFSLGQHRQLPRVLGRVHPTRLTPYVAIILFGIVAMILILPGEIPLLADLYAFGSMIAFTAAHVSVDRAAAQGAGPGAAVPAPAQRHHRQARRCRSPPCCGATGHLLRVVRHPLLQAVERAHRHRLGRRRHRRLRHLPQGAGLLADQDGQVARRCRRRCRRTSSTTSCWCRCATPP